MGLDMYAFRKTYVKRWAHEDKAKKFTVSVKRGGKKYAGIKSERVSYVQEELAYWRKANAIHKWFVENVQDGQDDCKEYYVSHDDLGKLVRACKAVLDASRLVEGAVKNGEKLEGGTWVPQYIKGKIIEDPSVANELLPTESGFFFGGTDYDEYYLADVKYTYDTFTAFLEEEGEVGEIYYHSSW